MSSSKPNYPAPDADTARPATETRVRARTDAEKTLPPSDPTPAKRRALLLVDGDCDGDDGDAARDGYDAVLTEADLEPDSELEHATLPRAETSEAPPSSLSQKENLTGQLVDGRYQVDYVLGVGSMGVVYGARHAAVGKLVALKALRQHLASDPEAIQRFNAEATAATAIGNAHIVETLDFGKLPDGAAYLVMEYLEGRSLADLIEGWAPLPLERIVRIGLQVAEALGAAHLAGIVHRDLKPDNVFLCERDADPDFVKILDFGIAKFGVSQARLTHAGAVFGTPAFMSPEQARGLATDGRTDIYALGVMLYEMACGHVPFQGENAVAVLTLQATETPAPLGSRVEGVSPEFESIVHKCLQKEPAERYASMAELGADLARLASGMPVRAQPRGRSAPALTLPDADAEADAAELARLRRKEKGSRWPWAILLMMVGSAAAYLFFQRLPSNASVAPRAQLPEPQPPPLASASSVDDGAPEQEVALVLFPLDARVFLGKDDLGPMPVSVKVREGQPVHVRVTRDGYWTRKLTLDGTKTRVVVGLVKRDEGKAPPSEQETPDDPPGSLPRAREAKPNEAKPSEAKPNEAKPNEAKPNEAKPNEAKPSEAKPSEAKPNEAKPTTR